jgi:hypothetical protein
MLLFLPAVFSCWLTLDQKKKKKKKKIYKYFLFPSHDVDAILALDALVRAKCPGASDTGLGDMVVFDTIAEAVGAAKRISAEAGDRYSGWT